jgi:hypothetical protein
MRWHLQFSAMCLACLGMISTASADTLQIAAPGFTAHGSNPGEVNQGLLLNAQGSYFAPVVFPISSQSVCQFKLIYRDNDADVDVTASLLRKRVKIGGNAFDPPVVMASVSSTGADANVRRAATKAVAQRQIDTDNSFYFVELVFPLATLEALGVEIDVQPTCP